MVTNGDISVAVTADFDAFYAQTGRRMLSLAFSLTGSWGDAEDLVQEAYVAAHRKWTEVGSYDDPAAWVRRVIVNRSVSRWRRLGREVNVRQRLAARAHADSHDAEPVDSTFWEAVRTLPAHQSRVVVLHYVDDMSVAAIASLLGCAPGTVKTQLFRARKTLAERLGAQIDEERDA
jgi:RNA polymerase sigma-70 factor, ECF subfamily